MVVVDENNCQGSVFRSNYITVYKPVADFDADNRFACEGSIITNFTNSSSALGSPGYLWDFGDGSSSVLASPPPKTYTENGHYTVSLRVTDENSCTNTKEVKNFIVLESVKADFSVGMDTICPAKDYFFDNLSSNANNYFWDFGDSTNSTAKRPHHTYKKTGDYLVTLKVSNSGDCFDTFSKIINIQEVIADFELSDNFSCIYPVSINYTNKSKNGDFWDWRFGNRTTSSQFEPIVTFTNEGIYNDTLIVTSKFGCKDTMVYDSAMIIKVPQAYCTPNIL